MSRTSYKALVITEMNDEIPLPLYPSSYPGIEKKKVLKSDSCKLNDKSASSTNTLRYNEAKEEKDSSKGKHFLLQYWPKLRTCF